MPAPLLVTVPVPEMMPEYDMSSERLIVSAALLVMLPATLPVVLPAPMLRMPALMVVTPL